MSKILAFAKKAPFMLALAAIALLVAVVSVFTSFWSTPNEASIGTPINVERVVSLDQVGEDQFDMRIAEKQFEHKLAERKNPQVRDEWFWQQRAYPADQISFESFRNAIDAETQRRTPQDQSATTWEVAGPMPLKAQSMGTGDIRTDVSGRALAVAIDPNDANHILVGAAQGGIWRSTDNGVNFTAVADNMPSLAIKVIRFAPSDSKIVYAGSGEPHGSTSIYGMGVFKSTDGGATWSALPSNGTGWDLRNTAVSGLQVDPTDPNILYVTTANTGGMFLPATTPTTGIFKSTDGGQTWVSKQGPVASTGQSLNGFMDLELFHANSKVLFATELAGGIYRSVDAGETWQLMTSSDLSFPAAVDKYSKFDTQTYGFKTLSVGTPLDGSAQFDRIEIALAQSGGSIQANDPNTYIIYAGYSTKLQLEGEENKESAGLLFKSTDGGTTWQWLGDWGNPDNGNAPNYCTTQCDYDNMVEVNPSDPNDIIVGGNGNTHAIFPDPIANPTRYINRPWSGIVMRSLDGGSTWIDTTPACTNYVAYTGEPSEINGVQVYQCQTTEEGLDKKTIHVDVQGAAYDWANKQIYVVNDGGLNRATVSGDGTNSLTDYTWETLNDHLSTLQMYNIGSHPTEANKILGAMQDNGVGLWDGTSWIAWPGGDGTASLFDPKEPKYVYWGDTNSLSRHDEGGSIGFTGWYQIFRDQNKYPFVTILEIDPVESNIIYVATNTGIERSKTRGGTVTGTPDNPSFVPDLETISAEMEGEPKSISVSPKDNSLVWVGTGKGQVYLIENETQFTRTGSNFPNRSISKIEASPNDANTVYVTFNGYDSNSANFSRNGNGNTGKVFKSTDKGMTWQNISGNMTAPNFDVPVLSFAVDPNNENNMWVGTDTGTRLTTDGGTTWVSYRHNMPPVSVVALEYNATTGYLVAGTHGRGIWRVQPGSAPTAITMGNLDATNGASQPLLWSLITATMGLAAGALFFFRRRRRA